MKTSILILLALSIAVVADGATWRVEKDGTGDFMVIQDAVDAAASGDTIQIGLGRFDDFATHTTPYNTIDCVVFFEQKDLTFQGSGIGETLIGPSEEMSDVLRFPSGIICQDQSSTLRFEGITFTHLFAGLLLETNFAETDNCEFRDMTYDSLSSGIHVTGGNDVIVRNCVFLNLTNGILCFSGFNEFLVEQCEFNGDFYAVDVQGATGIIISDSDFTDNTIGIYAYFGSGVLVEDSSFEQSEGYAIQVSNSCTCTINRITVDSAGLYSVSALVNSVVRGSDNVLRGGTISTLHGYTSDYDLHNSHILAEGGLAFQCQYYPSHLPVNTIDLTDNWWGVADADSIADLILDGNDDPGINVIVQFDPFAEGTVPNEDMSWSNLKTLFR